MKLVGERCLQRICALCLLATIVEAVEVKVFKQGVGKKAIEMVDETQFKNPEVLTFDDEIKKKIDFEDEYDELVPKLPKYEVHQFGKNIGYTLVPIVTRSKPWWSTPMPRVLLEKTWSTPDAIRKMTKSHKSLKATTALPRTSPDEELLPPDEEPQKKHRLSGSSRRIISRKFLPSSKTDQDEHPQIQVITPQVYRASSFRRVTVAVTTPASTTKTHRTHPVWHNPNFVSTQQPLHVANATQSSAAVTKHKSVSSWQPWWKHNQTHVDRSKVMQVLSILKTSEDGRQKSVRRLVQTSEFLSPIGRHVVSTTSDGTPVEIIVAPESSRQKPSGSSPHTRPFHLMPALQRTSTSNGAWSWHREWYIGPDGKRVESFTSMGNVPSKRLPKNHTHTPSETSSTTVTKTVQLSVQTVPGTATSNQPRLNTIKCRILEAMTDGKAAPDNDPNCKLLYPGYPADNTCKCTFHVNGRDEQGCAVGFLYTCKPTTVLADFS